MAKKTVTTYSNKVLTKDPPEYLGDLAKDAWRWLVPFLKKRLDLKSVDSALVEMYCSQYEIYRLAYDDIMTNGPTQKIYKTIIRPTGEVEGKDFVGIKRNPNTQIYSEALKSLQHLSYELALSPKARRDMQDIMTDPTAKKSQSSSAMIYDMFGGGHK